MNDRKRAISIRNEGSPAVGTLGWVTPASGHDDSESEDSGIVFFSPDNDSVCFNLLDADVCYVADGFNPSAALKESMTELAEIRLELDKKEYTYALIKRTMDAEIKPYVDLRKAAQVAEKVAYDRVVLFAQAALIVADSRDVDPDVTFRAEKWVEYDAEAAFRWAVENGHYHLLTLNNSLFESEVKDGKVPTRIAKLRKANKPYISKDLSERIRKQ